LNGKIGESNGFDVSLAKVDGSAILSVTVCMQNCEWNILRNC